MEGPNRELKALVTSVTTLRTTVNPQSVAGALPGPWSAAQGCRLDSLESEVPTAHPERVTALANCQRILPAIGKVRSVTPRTGPLRFWPLVPWVGVRERLCVDES